MRPEIETALRVLKQIKQISPDLAQQLARTLPALAIDFTNAGKEVSEISLLNAVKRSIREEIPLRELFITHSRRSAPELTYHNVFSHINKQPPFPPQSFKEAVLHGNSLTLRKMTPTPQELGDMRKHAEEAIDLGRIDIWRELSSRFPVAKITEDAILRKAAAKRQFHIMLAFEQESKNAYHSLCSNVENSELEERLLNDRYQTYKNLCAKFPKINPEKLVGLEAYTHSKFDIKLKEYLKIAGFLSREIPNVRIRNKEAFKATLMFQSAENTLRFMKKWGEIGKSPLHQLLMKIQPPILPNIDWRAWGGGLLKYGMDMAFLIQFAEDLPAPIKNLHGKISLRLTRDTLSKTAYSRKDESLELAELCFDLEIPENIFNLALDIWLSATTETSEEEYLIPSLSINCASIGLPDYRLEKMSYEDPRILFLGEYTGCCEKIGDYFQGTIIDALETRKSGFYVLMKDDEIMCHSWVWRGDEGQLIIDGFETMDETITSENLSFLLDLISKELSDPYYHDCRISDVNIGVSATHLFPQENYVVAPLPADRFILADAYWSGEYRQWQVARLSDKDYMQHYNNNDGSDFTP